MNHYGDSWIGEYRIARTCSDYADGCDFEGTVVVEFDRPANRESWNCPKCGETHVVAIYDVPDRTED